MSLLKLYKKNRKFWIINPITRITPNKKKKNRMKRKEETKKIIKEELR